jgi:PIN domain nuclease of toxin-antitoxin system
MQLAEILKTLDIDLELDDGAIVTDAIVAVKVQRLDGKTTVAHAMTEGTDWITAVGLSEVQREMVTQNMRDYEGDNE